MKNHRLPSKGTRFNPFKGLFLRGVPSPSPLSRGVDEPDHVVIACADCQHYVGHGITGTAGMAVSVALRPEKIRLSSEKGNLAIQLQRPQASDSGQLSDSQKIHP